MAAPRDRKHIIVPGGPSAEPYSPHPRTIPPRKPAAPQSRSAHGKALRTAFEAAESQAAQRRESAGLEIHGAEPGLYVLFESQPGVPLNIASLEDARQHIEVVAVTHVDTTDENPERIERATVFVPQGKVTHFIKRFAAYSTDRPKSKKRERRYEAMLDPVAALQLATLRGLWTDTDDAYPKAGENIWWEVWLRRHDGDELSRFMEFAQAKELSVGARRLEFDDRIVLLARATPEQLSSSIDVLNDLAEVRRAKETAAAFHDLAPEEQGDWVEQLFRRIVPAAQGAPAVCVLDTGVTQGHPLLQGSLDAADCHACDPMWGTRDDGGHGTEMAGLALYGDLTPLLQSDGPVELHHRLESVKILPPIGQNPPELYGAVTAEATARVEIQSPERLRTFSMAITATDERDRGQPTSWSAAVDALAAGRSFDSTKQGLVYIDDGNEPARRLFVISAGNIDPLSLQVDHLNRSDTDAIHDPGQAWNALTVGAYTEKDLVQHPNWVGWKGVAPAGDLSPWSTTGVSFADAWPLKPDVVFEGGNVVTDAGGNIDFPCPDLCLLTTHFEPAERPLELTWATSPATAQVARIAARVQAEYPSLWPEAVRALVVHSAEWTPRMRAHLAGANGKRPRARLVRRYGFGVPSLQRALRSATDALTLVAQGSIRPFAQGKMRELHFFELPWPRDVLLGLGETPVRLRVTLSYFIEPNPGRRGWRKRHRYSSHGLRFEVKGPTESMEEFRKSINQRALDEDESKPAANDGSADWYLGEQARNRGSLHSDFLAGSAADIAERGVVAIYPVSGWWKDQPKRDRSEEGARYCLVMSIDTPGVEADIWSPVAQQVGVPVHLLT